MSKSYIAQYIDEEYRREQAFKRNKRQPCKTKDCIECKFFEICTERNEMDNMVDGLIKEMRGERYE